MKHKNLRKSMELARIQIALDKARGGAGGEFHTSYTFASWSSASRPTVYRHLELLVSRGCAEIQNYKRGEIVCKRYRLTDEFVSNLLPKEIL